MTMTITSLNTQNIYRLRTTQNVQTIIIKVKPKTGQGFCFKEQLCGQLGKTIRIFNHYQYRSGIKQNRYEVCESLRAKQSGNKIKTKPINFSISVALLWSNHIHEPIFDYNRLPDLGTQVLLSAQIRPIPVP